MKMSDMEVVQAVQAELDRAESFMATKISPERAAAYDYYYSKLFGTEQEGRSQVVSSDVAQAIDAALPKILKVFVSSDKAVEFQPRGPEDVEAAEQATLSGNYVFFSQNDGYSLAQDFIKDGLLSKTGVFKWTWDNTVSMSEKTYRGLDDMTLQVLSQDPAQDIIAVTSQPDPNAMQMPQQPGQPPQPPGQIHDVTVRIKKEAGKIKIIVPPPEDILISPDSMSLNVMEMPFIAHTPFLTASDLLQLGVKQDVIDMLPKGQRYKLDSLEKVARDTRTEALTTLGNSNDVGDAVYQYNECYLRLDEDGDGVAELRRVCIVGTEVLFDDPVDHIPLSIWTPKVMPHEVIGMSLADEVMDLQLLKSTVWRGINDSMYQSIVPRMFVTGDVNMEDVLTVKPGGIIRGEPNSALTPITIPFVGQQAFPLLEYIDQEKDSRIGFSALGPGLDPNSINKTATFVNAMQSQTGDRAEIIARNAAEYGFKPLFRGIMYLLAKHQQKALMVRLSNKFIPVDPETWSREYDMTCSVGLGVGSKEQQLMHLQALGMDLQAIGASPFAAQLLSADKVFNYVQKKAELAGFPDVTIFLNDPEGSQPQPPPKDPLVQAEEVKAQASMQTAQMKSQSDAQKLQAEQQADAMRFQAQAALDEKKMVQEMALEREKMAGQMALEREKFQAELEFKMAEKRMEIDAQYEIEQMRGTNQINTAKAGLGMEPGDMSKMEGHHQTMLQAMQQLYDTIGGELHQIKGNLRSPKKVIRGKDGRVAGVEHADGTIQTVQRGPDGRVTGVQ